MDKDRVLRGNGIQFPPLDDAGQWGGLSSEEIARLGDGLKAALPRANEEGGANPGAARPTPSVKVAPRISQIDVPEEHLRFWLDHHCDLARRDLAAEIVLINSEMHKRGLLHSGDRMRRIARAGAELLNRCTTAALTKAAAETDVLDRCDLVADSLSSLVQHVRARVGEEISRSKMGPLDQKVRESCNKLVDQIALDLAASIRLARPSLTSPAVESSKSGSRRLPPGPRLKPGPRPDPDWEWAIGVVTSEVLSAGYSKPLPRGGRAAIETMLLTRMEERDKHFTEDSARKYARRVIDALPERAE